MLILPAIDLRGGRCVRLTQGDYSQERIFDEVPETAARRWVSQGAHYLHLVDLDGAKEGRPVNGATIKSIVDAAQIPCELGGGVRTQEDIVQAFSWGIERIVIGTQALKNPSWLQSMCRAFPGRIAVGIDARDGMVATDGWLETSSVSALDLAHRCQEWHVAALIYTDIRRDGMMAGPNLDALAEMARAVQLPVIASGGVTTLEDVRQLARLPLAGCIIGRALYEGRLQLAEVIGVANSAVRQRGGST